MIIRHFTDNDLYKFTTMHAITTLYPEAMVKYTFIDRGETFFPDGFANELQQEVNKMGNLRLTKEEESFIKEKCYYFTTPFIDLLKGYQYNPEELNISQQDGRLHLEIEGYWYRTVLWEVPLLAIISELFFRYKNKKPALIEENARHKAEKLKELKASYSDFGTRRRFSFDIHDRVVKTLKEYSGEYFRGTSNVYLALKHNLTPIGTHPHEWFMYHGAHFGYRMANTKALEAWLFVYHGNLGIALADTYTTKNFFESFSTMQAKLFDGVRMDSGDPAQFVEETIKFYQSKRIDPQIKTIIFSDALNIDKVKIIKEKIKGRINDGYGIGTYLTNDVGVEPLNIVIKMTAARPSKTHEFVPVVKLSDTDEKNTGNKKELELCRKMLNI